MAPEAKVCNSGNFCPIFDPEKGTITEIFAYSHSEMISLKKMPQVSFLLLSECNSKKERGHVVGGVPPPLPPLLGLPRARWSHMPPLGPPPPPPQPCELGVLIGQRSGQEKGEGEENISVAHGTPLSLSVPATLISPPLSLCLSMESWELPRRGWTQARWETSGSLRILPPVHPRLGRRRIQAGLVLESTSQAGQVLQSTCQVVLVLQSTRKVGSGAAKHQKGGTWKGVQDTNPSWELVLRSILVQGPEQVPQMCT